MFIQGCILPIHFRSNNPRVVSTANPINQAESVKLMNKIKDQYDFLVEVERGNPEIQVAGVIQPSILQGMQAG